MLSSATQAIIPERSNGLYPTLWPADHGDTARRKYVTQGGLPAELDPSRVQLLENKALPYPQWMYTRAEDELFVYGVPSTRSGSAYFAKVDARTLKVRQRVTLPRLLYMGGALVHNNSDVYLVHGATLTRYLGGDLSRAQQIKLPLSNGIFTQHNGLSVTHDGMLLVKGWAMNSRELCFFKPIAKAAAGGLGVLGLGAAAAAAGGMDTAALGLSLMMPGLPLLAAGLVEATGSRLSRFARADDTGHLLLIDPETLEIVQKEVPPERLAYGRMAVGNRAGDREDVIIPGDEHIHRWSYANGRLRYDAGWTERYRRWGDGSFVATGPALWKQRAFYTNNTAAVGLGDTYKAFVKDLTSHRPQVSHKITQAEPGFMFWSTVIDPVADQVFDWDSASGFIEARDATTHARRWRAPALNTDCCTLQAQTRQLYAVDHDRHLSPAQLTQSVTRQPRWPDTQKDLLVLDADSGAQRLRVRLGAGSPVMAMIVPGYHDDLFVARRDALVRVHQR